METQITLDNGWVIVSNDQWVSINGPADEVIIIPLDVFETVIEALTVAGRSAMRFRGRQ